MEGWLKLHRKIMEHWMWEEKPFSRGQAWIDLLLLVNHAEGKVLFNGTVKEVHIGQRITSLRLLSERWGWSIRKVKKFLDELKKDKMLNYKSDKKATVLTIDNYGLYQDSETQKQNRSKTEAKQKQTNKNDKNVKNEKEKELVNKNPFLFLPEQTDREGDSENG